jgi:hypothetical protein
MSDFVWRPNLAIAGTAFIVALAFAGSAQAESIQKQCSTKYKAAKAADTLKGQTWNQFYKQCAAELKGTPTTPTETPTPAPKPKAEPTAKSTKPTHSTSTPAPMAKGAIVFPRAISPQYSNLSAGKARFKTCDDQYKANKATNSNGGLKWIQKGGGYYSECNKHLKGQ